MILSLLLPAFLSRPSIAQSTREFRGAWVATVDNIDWPSRKGLPTSYAKRELKTIIDRAADAHLNALLFQVRPMGDAFYKSPYEPWSEFLTGSQGISPDEDWDPLQFAIDECHRKGIELHAWFNPFRAWHSVAKSTPAFSHMTVRHREFVRQYGKQKWVDPGDPRAQDYTMRVILDVVKRYDIDGVHIDDYFYPYPVKNTPFPDASTYKRYGKGLSKQAWRRQNVDRFVERMYREVHLAKPRVKVGISPFGIYRPNVPAGIKASVDQYSDLYADPKKWLQKGWCDYMTPQIYWALGSTDQNFSRILKWWSDQNTLGRHIWPGLAAYKMVEGPKWGADELVQQIAVSREQPGVTGQIFFSAKYIVRNTKGFGDALSGDAYSGVASVPDSPWLRR
ncbi:MAG: hypothetical protein QOJ65_1846 [Fimbriimonadaceae bacterium]|nr:hypothetical protein [Fimbriimonadaceae bacterium]